MALLTIRDDPRALCDQIAARKRGVIAIDGCPGAGKTYLANELSALLGCDAIDIDNVIDRKLNKYVEALRTNELIARVTVATEQKGIVVLSGVCMRLVLEQIKSERCTHIYVMRITSAGLPGDLDILDLEEDPHLELEQI